MITKEKLKKLNDGIFNYYTKLVNNEVTYDDYKEYIDHIELRYKNKLEPTLLSQMNYKCGSRSWGKTGVDMAQSFLKTDELVKKYFSTNDITFTDSVSGGQFVIGFVYVSPDYKIDDKVVEVKMNNKSNNMISIKRSNLKKYIQNNSYILLFFKCGNTYEVGFMTPDKVKELWNLNDVKDNRASEKYKSEVRLFRKDFHKYFDIELMKN